MKDDLQLALIISDYKDLQEKLSENLSRKHLHTSYKQSLSLRDENLNNIVYLFLIVGFRDGSTSLTMTRLRAIFEDVQNLKPKSVLILPYGIENELINFAKENARNLKIKIIYLGEAEINDALIEKILHSFFGYNGENETVIGENRFKLVEKIEEIKEKLIEAQPDIVIRKILIPENKPIKVQRKRRKQNKIRSFGILIIIILWIIATPFLSLFISSFLLKNGVNEINNKDLNGANIYFETSKVFANIAGVGFTFSNNGKQIASDILKYDEIGIQAYKTILLGQRIFNEVNGNNDYDLKTQANQFYLNIDSLYSETAFLSASSNSKDFLPDTNLTNISFYLQSLRKLAKDLPNILGINGQKNYLVIVQDPNKLRPTGGYITNLIVYSFNNGRLINKNAINVDDVDSQLRGFVTPPDALKNYAGLASWNLANSNWDPDFSQASAKAEWFFNKETNQNIDGVIGITTDINNINFDNIISLLDSKNVQVFMNKTDDETTLVELNWDGGILANSFGIIDANVGNAGNNQIKENAVLNIKTNTNSNNYSLEIDYTNLSKDLVYKDDVRIIEGNNIQEKYFQLNPGKNTKLSFSWSLPKNNNLNLRKQPGVDNFPIQVVINNTTRYNIFLQHDKNISFGN
ncbi:MAG TPA: DUF4012 domain-containing protein [Patescibacteria group bacterium]|nr:DUF4012 domain-containing protein [Patescibacteria group bacterium]